MPGEHLSLTQPFPTKPAAFDRQGFTEDDLIDFTPQIRADALEFVQDYVLGPLYTPTTLVGSEPGEKLGTIHVPGSWGGRQLAFGGLRSGDGHILRRVPHAPGGSRRGCSAKRRGGDDGVHPSRPLPDLRPKRPAPHQASVRPDHRDRPDHGGARLDGPPTETDRGTIRCCGT